MTDTEPTPRYKKILIKKAMADAVNRQITSLMEAPHKTAQVTGANPDNLVSHTVTPKVTYQMVSGIVDEWIDWPEKTADRINRRDRLLELTSNPQLTLDDIKGTAILSDLRSRLQTLATYTIQKANGSTVLEDLRSGKLRDDGLGRGY